MKRPIEHEYNSFVSYARELEKYCSELEAALAEREALITEYLSIAKDSVHEITTLRTAAQQALDALNDVEDTVRDYAAETHEKYKGYKPHRHIAVDKDVATVAAAITALTALTAALESKT